MRPLLQASRALVGVCVLLAAACAGPLPAALCLEDDALADAMAPLPGQLARLRGVSRSAPLGDASADASDSPRVAWDGSSWVVAWGEQVVLLDGEGTRRTPAQDAGAGRVMGVATSGCEHALVGDLGRERARLTLRALDGEGTQTLPVASRVIDGFEASIASHSAGFVTATHVRQGGVDRIVVSGFGPGLEPRGGASWGGVRMSSPSVASVAGLAVVVVGEDEGITQRVVDLRSARVLHRTRVMAANVWMRGAIATLTLDERLLIAASDGEAIHVATTVPALGRVLEGPRAVLRTTARDVRPGLAAIPESELIAICAPAGPGPWGGDDVQDTVAVQLIDEDAHPVGPRFDVTRADAVHAVDCAWSGRELFVAWVSDVDGVSTVSARRIRFDVGAVVD